MEGTRSVAAKSTKAGAALAAASKAGDSPSCGFISGETEGWEPRCVYLLKKRRNGKKRPNKQNRLFYSRALFFTLHFPYIKKGDGAYLAVPVLLMYNPNETFYYVTSVCTVDLEILNFFAVLRTVASFSMM